MQYRPAGRDSALQRSPDKKTVANSKSFTIIPACLCVMFTTQYAIRYTQYDIRKMQILLTNDDGICYLETIDTIPKTIENCTLKSGDVVTVKFGEGLAWATIVGP